MADTIPQHLGRFEIIRPLGRGGMGQVYLAKDPSIGREVALKTISSDVVQTPKARERFLNEAKAAGTLSHPNLITIHEFGEDAGVLFLVMEYLEGEDLSALLRRRALQPAQALDLMAQVCDGLAYAHAKGVLHRDVKPSNVRVVEQSGRLVAKLMDFGVARLPDSQLTGTGDRVGTLSYMAPEYLRGGQPTVQCDLYPVGMMLHEALTGQLPSMGPTLPRGVARAPQRGQADTGTELPSRFLPLVHRAIAADPADRFPSAEAFASALRAAQKQDPSVSGDRISLPPITGSEPTSRAAIGWIAALLVLGAGGVIAWRLGHKPAPAPPMSLQAVEPQNPAPHATLPAAPASPPPAATAPVQAAPALPPPPAVQEDLAPFEAAVREHPQDAWTAAERRLQEHPEDGRALALRVASLYWMAKYDDMLTALQTAQGAGLGPDQLGSYPVIQAAMRDQHDHQSISQDLFQRMRPYLPSPRGGPQNGQQGPPQRPQR